jgi:hypothetical protein
VRSEAIQAVSVATSATVTCSDKESAAANRETTVAIGKTGKSMIRWYSTRRIRLDYSVGGV